MKKHNAHNFLILTALLGLFLFGIFGGNRVIPSYAEELNIEENYEIILQDDGDLLTSEEEQKLMPFMKDAAKYGHMVLLTTLENEGTPSDYTDAFFQDHFGEGPACIVLIDLDNGTFRFDNRAEIADTITNDVIGEIMDEVIGLAADGEYYLSVRNAFVLVNALMSGETLEDGIQKIETVDSYDASSVEPETELESEDVVATETEPEEIRETVPSAVPVILENPETAYQVMIFDEASLLSEEEIEALSEVMQPLLSYGHAAFLTTDDNPGTIEDLYTDFCNRYWGQETGVIFVIDMSNRELLLHSEGKINKIVDRKYCNTITDNVYKYAGDEEYFTCASEAFTEVIKLMNGQRIAQPMKYICNALIALIISVVIMFIVVYFLANKKAASTEELLEYMDYRVFIGDMKERKISSRRNPYGNSSYSGRGTTYNSSSRSSNSSRSSGFFGRSSGSSSYGSSSSRSSSSGSSSRSGSSGKHKF